VAGDKHMIAAVNVPLWVPAAVICVLCLLPDIGTWTRKLARHGWSSASGRLYERKLGGGRSSSDGGHGSLVATATSGTPAATDDWFAEGAA